MSQTLSCPCCRAKHSLASILVRWIVCTRCHHLLGYQDRKLIDLGEIPPLSIKSQSHFQVGNTGRLDGRPFEIIGHLHCHYTDDDPFDSYWEEWIVKFTDGTYGYLEEEGGILRYYAGKKLITSQVPSFDELALGTTIRVDQFDAVVLEKGLAKVFTGEGQHINHISVPQTPFQLVELSFNHYAISLEYILDQVYLYYGIPLDPKILVIDAS